MSQDDPTRIEISAARQNLAGIVADINRENLPRILTRYGRDVAILLPPGRYGLIERTPVDSPTVASVIELMDRPMSEGIADVSPQAAATAQPRAPLATEPGSARDPRWTPTLRDNWKEPVSIPPSDQARTPVTDLEPTEAAREGWPLTEEEENS